jgi:hypothetical protein
MPGSFPAFHAPSPSTSCFSATASELEEAIEVSTIRCIPKDEDLIALTTARSATVSNVEEDAPFTSDTKIKPPVTPNARAWTTVTRASIKPIGIRLNTSNVDSACDTDDVAWENVVERRGRRLQVHKNELRVKEDNNKLVKVDPDGMAVRSLDPRPCHRHYLGKLYFISAPPYVLIPTIFRVAKAGCDNVPCQFGHKYRASSA